MRGNLLWRAAAAGIAVVLVATGVFFFLRDDPRGSASTSSPWRLTWSDEFNGSEGRSPDPAKWVFDLGGEPKWGNNEWEYYTDRPQNASMDGDGHLAITARRERLPGMQPCEVGSCDITSARLTTKAKFDQAYGRFEARIKIPSGQGMWPAFWMLGTDDGTDPWPANGEIDVMEVVGKGPGTVYGTAHGPGFPADGLGGNLALPDGRGFADDFHTFAVEWSPTQLDWLVDGTRYFTLAKSDLQPGRQWVFDHPFYLLLNLAVGGGWPGPPDASTPFPATMLVDYVRAYTRA